jgi:hypothetical protein
MRVGRITIRPAEDWYGSADSNTWSEEDWGCFQLLPLKPCCRVMFGELLHQLIAANGSSVELNPTELDTNCSIHRSTRSRCFKRLRDLGLISGTNTEIIINDPRLIAKQYSDDSNNRLHNESFHKQYTNRNNDKPEEKEQRAKPQVSHKTSDQNPDQYKQNRKIANDSWNLYRPKGYEKSILMNKLQYKAIITHMNELDIEIGHSAEDSTKAFKQFFSHIRSGLEGNSFYMTDIIKKTLSAVVGYGDPDEKKRRAVFRLYTSGLERGPSIAETEEDRDERYRIPKYLKPFIDEYFELNEMMDAAANGRRDRLSKEQCDRITELYHYLGAEINLGHIESTPLNKFNEVYVYVDDCCPPDDSRRN